MYYDKYKAFHTMYLNEPVLHDDKSCNAMSEFLSLPYDARHYDMMRIANKYNTTPQDMRYHKDCHKHLDSLEERRRR